MSGSVSSSILETEEDREELPTLGRGALRKLLLETMADSPAANGVGHGDPWQQEGPHQGAGREVAKTRRASPVASVGTQG